MKNFPDYPKFEKRTVTIWVLTHAQNVSAKIEHHVKSFTPFVILHVI